MKRKKLSKKRPRGCDRKILFTWKGVCIVAGTCKELASYSDFLNAAKSDTTMIPMDEVRIKTVSTLERPRCLRAN